jgi:REP element-mobilizing transposase RayT
MVNPSRRVGARKLRLGRRSLQNHVYHVTTSTVSRAALFTTLNSGRCVVQSMRRIQTSGIAETWSYVVMPDHVHWLLQLHSKSSLSDCVASMKAHSSRLLNGLTKRHGPVWQRGFYDRCIRADEDLLQVARYLVANPLRAGLVSDICDYSLWDSIWI